MITRAPRCFAVVLVAGALSALVGCTTSETAKTPPQKTGFLTTYRNLEPRSAASMAYLDPNNRLARYDKFIVPPVEIRMYEADASKATPQDLETITSYMHSAIVNALSTRYQVVTVPSGTTAEVHVAITNIQKSTPILNVIPRPKVTDIGLGGLSMESEILDSVSDVQIAALLESRTGQNRWIDFSQLDDTKPVMDEWARQLLAIVDEAHGSPSTD